ncbi:adenosylhomocysteinase, partial [Leucobacter sp. M11]|uniref:adenosylhomocysteinase n=1 Tax=Leucobacter sp. M11 TaxID=2993565 RepID=UPI002D7E327F
LLDWGPELLIDDGSHLIRLAHTERPGAFARLRGAAEETTSGVRPLVELAADGGLRVPVIGVNNARTKTLFDNLVGTGQSCVLAIADLLDPEGERPRATPVPAAGVAGQRWLVIGYGPVGAGTARHARALGARVTVHDTDPVRALSAQHDGFPSTALLPGIAGSDVVVSATGVWHTVGLDALAAARPGTVFAVAGGIDDELALDDAARAAWISDRVRPGVRRWRAPGEAADVLVLADGGGVNYTAGEGNPVEIMDLSFGTQLAALRQLVDTAPEPGLVPLRAEAEAEVARIALRGSPGEPPASPERPDTAPAVRPGGAAQHWSVHRYRSTAAENLEE